MDKQGTIYQRGSKNKKEGKEDTSDGRWVGRYPVTDPLTGITKDKYVYSSKPGRKGEQEVKRKLNALIEKVEKGDLSDIYKITVSGWLEKYLKIYCDEAEVTTLEGYTRYINNHIIPVLRNKKLYELRPLHVQAFYNSERNFYRGKDKKGNDIIGYSEKTILQEHRILHRAFKKAVSDGYMSRNPCDGIDAPSPLEYEPTVYTEQQYITLLERLEKNRMAPIILIAGMCGLRRGELLALTWDDMDLEKGILSITKNTVPTTTEGTITKKPKTKKSVRDISIPSSIIPILKSLRGIGKLYTKLDGDDYNPGSVSRLFKQFLEDNSLPHIRLHDLRHFNATMMLKNGVTDKEAAERLGHSDTDMTKKYQHILEGMDKKSADKLNNVLKPKKNNKNSKGVKNGVKA